MAGPVQNEAHDVAHGLENVRRQSCGLRPSESEIALPRIQSGCGGHLFHKGGIFAATLHGREEMYRRIHEGSVQFVVVVLIGLAYAQCLYQSFATVTV